MRQGPSVFAASLHSFGQLKPITDALFILGEGCTAPRDIPVEQSCRCTTGYCPARSGGPVVMGGSQSAESEDDDPLITERFGSTPEQEDLWLLPARTLIEFHELLPFATLFSRRRLVKWTRDSNRTVVMISHQWSATGHPDPKMRQTAVLQQLLHHMASGKVAAGYQEFGEQETPSLEEQRRCLQWDLWYDYCCDAIPDLQGSWSLVCQYTMETTQT
eukprot:s59_g15.t4